MENYDFNGSDNLCLHVCYPFSDHHAHCYVSCVVCVFNVRPTGFFTWCNRRFKFDDYDGSAVARRDDCRNHRTTIIWYCGAFPKYGRTYRRVRVYLRKNQAPSTWPWLLPTLTDSVSLSRPSRCYFQNRNYRTHALCTTGVERFRIEIFILFRNGKQLSRSSCSDGLSVIFNSFHSTCVCDEKGLRPLFAVTGLKKKGK